MADRKDFFFKQKVTEAELDGAFLGLEEADQNAITDQAFEGVTFGLQVVEDAPPALTVEVNGPGAAYDQTGRRVGIDATQTVDLSIDSASVSTAVGTPGNAKIVSLFIRFKRFTSDPRIDGNSQQVFFVQDEGFEFVVVQGAEAVSGSESPPALLADGKLLADVTLIFGQTQILTADIDLTNRRQDQIVLTGAAISDIREGRFIDGFAALVAEVDAFIAGAAAAVAYAGGPNWADGTTNPATNVEAQLDKIVTDLATAGGTAKIQGDAAAGAPSSLTADQLNDQLVELLGFINARALKAGDAFSGDVTLTSPSRLLATVGGQDIGTAALRFDLFAVDINVSGNYLFDANRTFRRIVLPRPNIRENEVGGTLAIANISATPNSTPTYLEFTGAGVGDDFEITWQLFLPDGAFIDSINFHIRTGALPGTDTIFVGAWRQPNDDATGSKEFFDSSGSGLTTAGSPAANTDISVTADQETAASTAAIDNDANSYFLHLATLSSTESQNNFRVYSVEIVLRTDRVRQ